MQLRKAGQPLGGLEFELCEGSAAPAPAVGPNSARRSAAAPLRRRRAAGKAPAAPFASVSLQGAGSGSMPAAKNVPAFMVASAAESAPRNLEGVPQWRITAGDLAAGATAGCAVEAGALRLRACLQRAAVGLSLRCRAWRSSGGLPLLVPASLRCTCQPRLLLLARTRPACMHPPPVPLPLYPPTPHCTSPLSH